jgi:hypothetical protein
MMATIARKMRMDQSATYRIEVQGQLSEEWLEWYGMQLAVAHDEGGLTVSTLTGELADQAALHGLLDKLYTLNLPLVAVAIVKVGEV